MKAKNVVIVILIIIILGQFIQFILLLRRFDQLKFTYEQDPVRVYVAGLTERIREVDQIGREVISQARWLSNRLGKCIERLETEKGLEPIPIKRPVEEFRRRVKDYDPNATEYAPSHELFYKPYESPNTPPLQGIDEGDVRVLMCLLNLQILGHKMYLETSNAQIENYEKRLKRLESHLGE